MIIPKLYYSDKCKFCKELLELLKSSELKIEMINVDYNPYPKDTISSVPTLISTEFTKPLVGKSVFDWVKNQRYFNSSSNNINLSRGIKYPQISDLLNHKKIDDSNKEKYCSIRDSTNLLI